MEMAILDFQQPYLQEDLLAQGFFLVDIVISTCFAKDVGSSPLRLLASSVSQYIFF
jgi:hypothetical protein